MLLLSPILTHKTCTDVYVRVRGTHPHMFLLCQPQRCNEFQDQARTITHSNKQLLFFILPLSFSAKEITIIQLSCI